MILVELALEIVGHAGAEHGSGERQPFRHDEFGRRSGELLAGEIFNQVDIDPRLIVVAAEQVAFDPATGRDVALPADRTQERRGGTRCASTCNTGGYP